MTPRAVEKDDFLRRAGWGAAQRTHLAGDASARQYERLRQGARSAVLMDCPPGPGNDTAAFLRIGAHLAGLGLSAPRVLDAAADRGLLLLEDLGDGLYTTLLARDPSREARLYAAAVEVLIALHAGPLPGEVQNLSARDWAAAAGLAPAFYTTAIAGAPPRDTVAFTAALEAALVAHADAARVLILRDYHAGNLVWLPRRRGLARVGLLDFQDAQAGQAGYDLVSLLQDARRDVDPATEAMGLSRLAAARGVAVADLAPAYAVLGAQRALRILGIFARLCLVAGKPGYVAHVPRVWGQLLRNLAHPALADLKAECLALLPEPTPGNLARISAQCGSLPSP